jgi:5'-nucleotidase
MAYPIDKKLVIAISATALFDLTFEHKLYCEKGLDEFRKYQKDHRKEIPRPGVGFPFIKRLLFFNDLYKEQKPVEVVILSRHHADAGLRIMDAVNEYGLDITRAFFMAGRTPFPFMDSVNACLYLSTDKNEVREAVTLGYPVGCVLPCEVIDNDDKQLRIAFDFDGVIVDDEAEKVFNDSENLELFQTYEVENRDKPLKSGPLMSLLKKISYFQKMDCKKAKEDPSYKRMLRIAIVTARNAPAHERLINTLLQLDIDTDELFLLGGIEKKRVLDVLKPHIFFDDQLGHLKAASINTPSVHIPFGIKNSNDSVDSMI